MGEPRRAVDPQSERVAATRARLLDAAERLFLEHDPESVSIRTINAAAGLNPGAVHYHFGSRHGLVLALLEDRLRNRLHLAAALDDIEARDDVRIRDVVAAAVDPLLRLARGNRRERLWLRLLIDAAGRNPSATFADPAFSPKRWQAAVAGALPDLAPEVVAVRWTFAVTLLLAVIESRPDRDELIDFLVGGLTG